MIGIYSITLMHIILYYGRNVAVDLLDRYLDCQKINWTLEFLVNDGWKKKYRFLKPEMKRNSNDYSPIPDGIR